MATAVAVGDVIGLIEVMKSFNEVKAEVAGNITLCLPTTRNR
jgi:acetyl-CoA carboxylase biotin carboxyl carrier protein